MNPPILFWKIYFFGMIISTLTLFHDCFYSKNEDIRETFKINWQNFPVTTFIGTIVGRILWPLFLPFHLHAKLTYREDV